MTNLQYATDLRTGPALRAAIYRRISKDDKKDRAGVERQDEDCLKLCATRGYRVVWNDDDNHMSASAMALKPRPKYDEMIRLVEAGEVDVIVGYTNARLIRRPLDLEHLIQVHERTGVLISTVKSGDDDLSTASGRMIARMKAAIDAHEAEVTRERTIRALQDRRDAGLPTSGGPMFGYVYTPVTKDGPPAGYTVDESLRHEVESAYASMLAGGSYEAIGLDWNARGITTTRGGRWSSMTVRNMLKTGFAAGWIREHSHYDRKDRQHRMNSFDVWRQGAHDPIIGQETWEAFKALIAVGPKYPPRFVYAMHPLSGVVVCGLCGATPKPVFLVAKNDSKQHRYICPRVRDYRAHIAVSVSMEYAEAEVLRWLDSVIEGGESVQADAERIARSRAATLDVESHTKAIAELKRKRLALATKVLNDEITGEDGKYLRDEIDSQLTAAETARASAELARVQVETIPLPVFTTLREEWPLLSAHHQRDALDQIVKDVRVFPPIMKGGKPRVLPRARWENDEAGASTGEEAPALVES